MEPVVADLNPKTLENAKRQFVEVYGSAVVTNTYLRVAVVLVAALAVGLLVLNVRTQVRYANVKPLVIRIDDVGRAEAVAYDASTYRPQAPELRYFLTRFIVTHFSRLRATIQREYPDSLFFLTPGLADATIAHNDETRMIQTFLTNADDEIDVDVKNVALAELTAPPYKASVDFEKKYYAVGTRQERKRERYVAHLDFLVRDGVPNAFIRINPLGIQVTYFRVDQAFEETRP
jgi:type IV secretory pathway TrbF-like protein